MEKVLQILVVLALLMLAINYYIKAEKKKFRIYYPLGRFNAPNDLLWNLSGVDPDNQLLFIPANKDTAAHAQIPENTGNVEVLDADTREWVASISVGEDPGAQVFDPETRLLYSANGDGTVSINRQVSRNTYRNLQTLATRPGCLLIALDTRTKRIYLPVKGIIPEMWEPTDLPTANIDCWVYSNQ